MRVRQKMTFVIPPSQQIRPWLQIFMTNGIILIIMEHLLLRCCKCINFQKLLYLNVLLVLAESPWAAMIFYETCQSQLTARGMYDKNSKWGKAHWWKSYLNAQVFFTQILSYKYFFHVWIPFLMRTENEGTKSLWETQALVDDIS